MCFQMEFITDKPILAKKNVVCYKRFINKKINFLVYEDLVNDILLSPYKKYKYEEGARYIEDSMLPYIFNNQKTNSIYYGFHCYYDLEKAKLETYKDEVLVKCIIPKGGKYYINKINGECICDEIIIGTDEDIIEVLPNQYYNSFDKLKF